MFENTNARRAVPIVIHAAMVLGVAMWSVPSVRGQSRTRLAASRPADVADDPLAQPDARVRLKAVKKLAGQKTRAAIDSLIRATADANLLVSEEAASALEKMKSPLVVTALLDALPRRDHDDRPTKKPDRLLKEILTGLEGAYVIKPLLAGLNHTNSHARFVAAKILVKRGEKDVDVQMALAKVAIKDPSHEIRHFAQNAIAKAKDPRIAAFLVKSISREKNRSVRERALELAVPRLPASKAVPLLLEALRDEDLSHYAFSKIQHFRDAGSIQYIAQGLRDRHQSVRDAAILVLGYSTHELAGYHLRTALTETAEKHLIAALTESSAKGRRCAARMLGEARSKKSVDPMIRLLKTDRTRQRAYLAEALGRIGDAKAAPALLAVLKDPASSDSLRKAAVEALGRIGPSAKDAVPELILLLRGRNTRDTAAVALGRIGTPNAVATLRKRFRPALPVGLQLPMAKGLAHAKDPKAIEMLRTALAAGKLREDVAIMLLEIGDEQTVSVVHRLAKKGYTEYDDWRFIDRLGAMEYAGAVKMLLRLLDIRGFSDQDRIERALSHGNPKISVPLLTVALKSSKPVVRYVIVGALGTLGDTRAAPAIIGALTDKDRDVRERAAKVLAVLAGEGPDQAVAMGPAELEKWWKTWWKKHRKVTATQPGR